MHQITIGFDSIPTPKEIAARLRMTAEMYEGADAKTASAAATTTAKPARAAKPAKVEETFDLGDDEVSAEETAIAYDMNKDVIPAAKDNREVAARTLKKMGLKSVRDLKPEQYADFMSAVKV